MLITGAARGIGRKPALGLAADGCHVHAGVRSDSDGKQLCAAASSGQVTPVLLDVTDAEQVAALRGALPTPSSRR